MNNKTPEIQQDLEDNLTLPEIGFSWVVIHSRPRCEKKVQQFCSNNGYQVYLPLHQRMHNYGSRIRSFLIPLFPGYVFCCIPNDKLSYLRQNRYVANLLDVVRPDVLIKQLRQVRDALETGLTVEVLPFINEGKPVKVIAGPFKGLEGLVVRLKGKTRVVVNVDLIQQAMSVEVDIASVTSI